MAMDLVILPCKGHPSFLISSHKRNSLLPRPKDRGHRSSPNKITAELQQQQQQQVSNPTTKSSSSSVPVPTHRVTVHDRQRGVVHQFLVPEDQYILHTAESQNISLPFACRHDCCRIIGGGRRWDRRTLGGDEGDFAAVVEGDFAHLHGESCAGCIPAGILRWSSQQHNKRRMRGEERENSVPEVFLWRENPIPFWKRCLLFIGTGDRRKKLRSRSQCGFCSPIYRRCCCTSCAVRIKSGQIKQPEALGISAELKSKGYALLCVGFPSSDIEVETQDEDEVYLLQFGRYFARGPVERDDYALELAMGDE